MFGLRHIAARGVRSVMQTRTGISSVHPVALCKKASYNTAAEAAPATPDAPPTPAAPAKIEPPANAEHIRTIARQLKQLDLVEMMYICNLIKQEFSIGDEALVSSNPNAAANAAGNAGAAQEAEKPKEKTDFLVRLEGYPADAKLKVVKQVRLVMPELSIVEAKNLVEGAPKVMKPKVSKEEAEKIKAKMEEVGAKIVIE
eukprot:TRINITY_DN5586_c0_g1_i1.p1 TRINITY_DN5586_c0_g1~~TRINITY_DN5586_c0_g1_i1.p1  ORF type:complete len:200 (+),score=63.88 TRINITY_DN5586_c0_g1_i1:55-654(+)